jgi:hypothetical protein
MAISRASGQKLRVAHDFDQKPGTAKALIADENVGAVAVSASGSTPDGSAFFELCDGTNNEGYIGVCLVGANKDAGITALKNTIISGFAGVLPGKEVFLGQNGWFTQDVAGVDAPSAAPTLAESVGAGALAAGVYTVGFSYVDAETGETILGPTDDVTIAASKQIDVSAVTPLPAGVDSVNWYMSVAPGSATLKFILNNNGSAHSINALPAGNAASPLTSVAASGSRRVGVGFTSNLIALD